MQESNSSSSTAALLTHTLLKGAGSQVGLVNPGLLHGCVNLLTSNKAIGDVAQEGVDR